MATPLFLYWDVTLSSFEARKFTKLISYSTIELLPSSSAGNHLDCGYIR